MPFLVLVILIVAAAILWSQRNQDAIPSERSPKTGRDDLFRKSYKPRPGVHPVDCVDDQILAASALIAASFKQDRRWNDAAANAVYSQIRKHFDVSLNDAEEIVLLGHWLSEQGCRDETLHKLTQRVGELGGADLLEKSEDAIRALCFREGSASDGVNAVLTLIRKSGPSAAQPSFR